MVDQLVDDYLKIDTFLQRLNISAIVEVDRLLET